ncbi:peptidase S8/S53 domain-containing protein [Mycena galericulata]|nr:peptidase S8/S53 domain-containing protein [Mycena galericulata]
MRVAGCIVFFVLALPVSTVPVLNEPRDCEDTFESTSTALSPSVSLSAAVTSSAQSASVTSSCGPVPTNTIPHLPDALPNQYIVSLKPDANITQHLAKVQAALAADRRCDDPGAPKSSLNSTQVVTQDNDIGSCYVGIFTDRDVAWIQKTPEFNNITRDIAASESRKRAVGTTWNLARLAQADKLQPGHNGQGTSATSSDWSVSLKDGLGQGVYIYVIDTGVDGDHPLLTPRVLGGRNVLDGDLTASLTGFLCGNVEGDGHGTEVAGAAAANNFGVASGATIVPIKSYGVDELISGVRATVSDFKMKKLLNKNAAAVINISIDSPNNDPLRENEKRNRCTADWVTAGTNPDIQAAINVGATDIDDQIAVYPDTQGSGSNYGQCVDIYAGGKFILTSGPGKAVNYLASGTSVAAPQVAGIIAAIISTTNNGFSITPADMKNRILDAAVKDKIQGLPANSNSNNKIAQLPDSLKQAVSATNPAPPTGSEAPAPPSSAAPPTSSGASDDDDWGEFQSGRRRRRT